MALRLDEILKSKGLNASSLSELMKKRGDKLSRLSIGNIINNKNSPKVETLEKIARALEIEVSELFTPTKLEPIYRKDENGDLVEIGYLKKLDQD